MPYAHRLWLRRSSSVIRNLRVHFCHSEPMETHPFGFRLPANAPAMDGFELQIAQCRCWTTHASTDSLNRALYFGYAERQR